jgi:hypothetical protein
MRRYANNDQNAEISVRHPLRDVTSIQQWAGKWETA